MTEAELYQQYLSETGKAQAPAAKPSDAELYQQYLKETQPAQPKDQTSALEAGTANAVNTLYGGYAPQLLGAQDAIIKAGGKVLDGEFSNALSGIPDDYIKARDAQSRYIEQTRKEHPYASATGDVAGGLTMALVTGGAGNVASEATTAGRLGQALKTGVTYGALRNPGDTEGQINPLQPMERIHNAGTDALTGFLFQGGLEGLGKAGKGIKNAGKNLAEFAENRALNAAGFRKKDFGLVNKLGIKSDVGRMALDEGIVQAGDSIADVAEKAVARKNEVGNQISKIYKTTTDELKNNPNLDSEIDLHKILDSYEAELVAKYKGKADGKKVISTIKDKLEGIRENPEKIDLEKLHEIQQDIGNSARKAKAFGPNQDTDVASELKTLRNKFRDVGQSKIAEVDNSLGTNFSKALKTQNKIYSSLKSMEDPLRKGLSAEEGNRILGLSEQIAGATGLATGGPATAIPLGLLARGVKKYGDSVAATAADKVSKIIESNPEMLGTFADPLIKAAKISPQRFSAQVGMMLKKPEFKKALEMLPQEFVADENSPGPSRSPSQKFTRKNK